MIKLFDEIPRLGNEQIALRMLQTADYPRFGEMIRDDAVYRYLPTFLFERQYDDLVQMTDALYHACFQAKESLILGIARKADG
jgi:ribosomal-protein-alanine N-acetyltransferase